VLLSICPFDTEICSCLNINGGGEVQCQDQNQIFFTCELAHFMEQLAADHQRSIMDDEAMDIPTKKTEHLLIQR
jgi:hypothetical protein